MKKIFCTLFAALCFVMGMQAQSSSRWDEMITIYLKGNQTVTYSLLELDSIGFTVPEHITSLSFDALPPLSGATNAWVDATLKLRWTPITAVAPTADDCFITTTSSNTLIISNTRYDQVDDLGPYVEVAVLAKVGSTDEIVATFDSQEARCTVAVYPEVDGIQFTESQVNWEGSSSTPITETVYLTWSPADALPPSVDELRVWSSDVAVTVSNPVLETENNRIAVQVTIEAGLSTTLYASYGNYTAECAIMTSVSSNEIRSIQFTESQYTFTQALYTNHFVYLTWSPETADVPSIDNFEIQSADATVQIVSSSVDATNQWVAIELCTSNGDAENPQASILTRDPSTRLTVTYVPNRNISAACDVVYVEPEITSLSFSWENGSMDRTYYAAPGTTITETIWVWWSPDFAAYNRNFFDYFSVESSNTGVRIVKTEASSYGLLVTVEADAGASAAITAWYKNINVTSNWNIIATTEEIASMAFEQSSYSWDWNNGSWQTIWLDYTPTTALPPTTETFSITSSNPDVVINNWGMEGTRVYANIYSLAGNVSSTFTATYKGQEMASCEVAFTQTVISQFYFEQDRYEWTAISDPLQQYINLFWEANEELASYNFRVESSDPDHISIYNVYISDNSMEITVTITPGYSGIITVSYSDDNGNIIQSATCEVSAVIPTNAVTSFAFEQEEYELEYLGDGYDHYIYITWGAADAIPPTAEELNITLSNTEVYTYGTPEIYTEERKIRIALWTYNISNSTTVTATYKDFETSCDVRFKQGEPAEIYFNTSTKTSYAAPGTKVTQPIYLYWQNADGQNFANTEGDAWLDRFNISSSNAGIRVLNTQVNEYSIYLELEGDAGSVGTITAEYGDLEPATFTWTIEETTQEITELTFRNESLDYSNQFANAGDRNSYWTWLDWSPANAITPTANNFQMECADPSVEFDYWYIDTENQVLEVNFYAPNDVETDVTVKYINSAGEEVRATIPFKSRRTPPAVESVADACVINIYFEEEPCYDVVFAGNYIDMDGNEVAWGEPFAKMQPLDGQPGWYTITVKPIEQADGTLLATGKPVQLDKNGNFDWSYQWERWSAEWISGNGEFVNENNGEYRIVVSSLGEVVHVKSTSWQSAPCTMATFNLTTTVPVTEGGIVHVVGDCFEQEWALGVYPMTRVDDYNWTITLPATIGNQYKYVVNDSWDNDMLSAPEPGYDCGYTLGNLTLNDTEVNDAVYGFANFGAVNCADIEFPEYTTSELLNQYSDLAAGDTTNYVSVRGTVSSIQNINLSSGKAQFYITDANGQEVYCYYIANLNNSKFVHSSQIAVGDEVVVFARLYNYQGTTLELINGWLTSTTNTFDASDIQGPKVVSVAEALNIINNELGYSEITPIQYQISGTVVNITSEFTEDYGTARFTITDDSGAEMYCYTIYYLNNEKWVEGNPQLEVGDHVTVVGQLQNYRGTTPEVVQGYLSVHSKPWKPVDMALISIGSLITDETFSFTDSEGNTNVCQLHMGTWYLYGDGITLTDGYFGGAGTMATVYAPIFTIVEDGTTYYYAPRKGFEVVNSFDLQAYHNITHRDDIKYQILAQDVSDVNAYGDFVQHLIQYNNGEVAELDNTMHNAYFATMANGYVFDIDFVNNAQYYPSALLKSGYFKDATDYRLTVDYFTNDEQHFWGLEYDGASTIYTPYTLQYDRKICIPTASQPAASGAPARKAAPQQKQGEKPMPMMQKAGKMVQAVKMVAK